MANDDPNRVPERFLVLGSGLPKSRLRELAKNYPPPQSWHEEDLDAVPDYLKQFPRLYEEPGDDN